MKLCKIIFVILLGSILSAGCGMSQSNNNKPNQAQNTSYDKQNNMKDNMNNNVNNLTNNVKKAPNNMANNAGNKMKLADKEAKNVSALKEIKHAYVIATNYNAYVAVVLKDDKKGKLTDELKSRISKQVKAVNPNIRNVYVSANPDFVDRMADYTKKLQEGKPVSGLVDELTEMVRRIFPNPK
ncbi:YhcN/YlaJ family sporulation lipoprotein [Metabacillus sp. RGM 3146]|uniref:YhcN/YlaJ family sporulation lipoprotein n=1 Tax=Metabacillus sp. RGM 3146 TaxID=3401092 RepID=UPI003B9C667A